MTKQEEPNPLESLELHPGDKVRATTESGTVYIIEAGIVVDGLLKSRVHRTPVELPKSGILPGMTIENAGIISWPSRDIGIIAVGRRIEVIGHNVDTNDRADIRSTPITSINYIEDKPNSPELETTQEH